MHSAATARLLGQFGIDHPIIQAGMGSDCGAALAAAVSNAGALGSVGSIGRSPAGLESELALTKQSTDRPWAVNILTFDWAPFAGALVDVAIAARAPVITLSFGDSVPALEKCNAAGIPTIVQVQTFAAAQRTLEARPAAIIVQGNEAGGHTGQRGTLSDQEAWDVAYYIDTQERPQDPRYTGNVKETRAKYDATFHKATNYGLTVNGKLLGDHGNTGSKPFLKPEALKPRTFTAE